MSVMVIATAEKNRALHVCALPISPVTYMKTSFALLTQRLKGVGVDEANDEDVEGEVNLPLGCLYSKP